MKEIEKFNINPSTNLIDVISSEYSFNSAIADLIDNCLDGKADVIKLLFEPSSGSYDLHIIDNGNGMTKEHLAQAAVIGFQSSDELRASNALGRYSSGLKSASNFLASSVIVTSKVRGKTPNILKIDYKAIKKNNAWEASFLDSFDKSSLLVDKGTMVSCIGLKEITSQQQLFEMLESLKSHLNHVFGKYLLNKKLSLSIATKTSKPISLLGWDPFYLPNNKSTKMVLDKAVPFKGKDIHFKIYILPSYNSLNSEDQMYMSGGGVNYNLNKLQGFYIYRSDRLISESGWLLPDFDITDKTRYARVEVCIPSTLDKYFHVNLTKTKIEIPHELQGQFKAIAQRARSESNKNYNYKKRPETKPQLNKKEDTIWVSIKTSKGVVLRLNKNSTILNNLCKKLSDSEFNQLINLIGKSFPLDYANSQEVMPEEYTENEIISMVKDLYNSLKEQKLELIEIHKKIIQMEPFSKYPLVVQDVFDELEKEDEDK